MKAGAFAILIIAALPALSTSVQVPQTAIVEGIVRNAVNDDPVAAADVRSGSLRTKTDKDGRFVMTNVPSGRRLYVVSKDGSVDAHVVTSGPQEHLTGVAFRLSPAGVVSGRVYDAAGRPVTSVSVQLMEYAYSRYISGQQLLMSVPSFNGDTNDKGEFRIFGIPTGTYIVRASPQPGFSRVNESLAATLYPGVVEISKADPVELHAGEELRLSDLVMMPSMGTIRVHVSTSTGQKPSSRMNVAYWRGASRLQETLEDVTPPGTEAVELRPGVLGTYLLWGTDSLFGLQGFTTVDFIGVDIDTSVVLTRLDGRITGRVLLEQNGGAPRPLRDVRLYLRDGAPIHRLMLVSNADGALQRATLSPSGLRVGEYEVSSGQYEFDTLLPADFYVASALQGTRDVLEQGITITNQDVPIQIMVNSMGGVFEGVIKDSAGKTIPDAVIAMIPESPSLKRRVDRQRTYRVERADQRGTFEIRGVIPGQYRIYSWSPEEVQRRPHDVANPADSNTVFSWSVVEDGALYDPAFMKQFDERGVPATIQRGERRSIELRIDTKLKSK
jgi:hypothetical protein